MNEKKVIKMNLCDPDTYKTVISECLEQKDQAAMPAEHLANVMALIAEVQLRYHPVLAEMLEGGGVEYTLTIKHTANRDTVKIKSKPVITIQDELSLTCEDPDQEVMDFQAPNEHSEPEGEDERDPLGLPSPKKKPLELTVDIEAVEGEGE